MLADLGSQTLGLWTRAEGVRACGEAGVRAHLARGEWQVQWPGVYADAGQQLNTHQRAVGAVLASGARSSAEFSLDAARAVAAGRTAARVHGFPLIDDDDPATGAGQRMVADVATRRRPEELRYAGRTLHRRQLTLGPEDVQPLAEGLWVLKPARTLLDLAVVLSHEALVCAVDDALRRDVADLATLRGLAVGRPGAVRLRAALAVADGRAESAGETLTRLLLTPHLPALVPQVVVQGPYGMLARIDLADEDVRFGVEFDGIRAHAGRDMVARDRKRERPLTRQGWHLERATWWDVRRGQQTFVARVLEEWHRHVARLAA